MPLSDREQDFLLALREGETARAYAIRHNYSPDWAKYISKEIRRKLGVQTLGEAVAMSTPEGVSRSEFEGLKGMLDKLTDAVEDLAKARPADQPAAAQVVAARELDVKDHARALGLSVADVEKLREEKDYERFRSMQARLDREKADEAAAAEGNGEGEGEGEKKGVVQTLVDGLGGTRNVKP